MGSESVNDQPPKNWKVPAKEIGGQNIVRFFSILLADEVLGRYIQTTRNLDLPLNNEFEPFRQEHDAIDESLKRQNVYFYGDNGSIFVDYKYMEDRWLNKMDPEHRVSFPDLIMRNFLITMTADQLVRHAREIVETWWE